MPEILKKSTTYVVAVIVVLIMIAPIPKGWSEVSNSNNSQGFNVNCEYRAMVVKDGKHNGYNVSTSGDNEGYYYPTFISKNKLVFAIHGEENRELYLAKVESGTSTAVSNTQKDGHFSISHLESRCSGNVAYIKQLIDFVKGFV